jgi:hypothetical protein
MQVAGLLKDKEETEALAALKRLAFGRLNKVIAIFTWCIKSTEGNFDLCFNRFPMLQKQMANI